MGALSSGVSGLQCHQRMLDVAGNNLANVNSTAFKASRVTFSELLSQTIKKASQPTATLGGTNPQQMGSGVGIASITPDMTQGNVVDTGNPLDLAMDGSGYFILNDGAQNVYTRAGAFTVDADSYLVDPGTGYRVQRIGSVGEADGFQTAGDEDIVINYDVAMPAQGTTTMEMAGNLSADGALSTAQIQKIAATVTYTTGGDAASSTTLIRDLDQLTGAFSGNGTLTATGFIKDGTAITGAGTTLSINSSSTLGDILTWLNSDNGEAAVDEVQTITTTDTPTGGTYTLTFGGQTTGDIAFGAAAPAIQVELELLSNVVLDDIDVSGGPLGSANPLIFTFDGTNLDDTDVGAITIDVSSLTKAAGLEQVDTPVVTETTKGGTAGVLGKPNARTSVASLVNGQIRITDLASGYSKTDLNLGYTASAGAEVWSVPKYFEVLTTGGTEVKDVNITVYDARGGTHSLTGSLTRSSTDNTWDLIAKSVSGDVYEFTPGNRRINGILFNNDGSYNSCSDTAEFVVKWAYDSSTEQTMTLDLGTSGLWDGLTQFSGTSTAVAKDQNGYAAGKLSGVSINKNGIVVGAFSNGVKKNIATIKLGLFQNAGGLESIGSGYFLPSANSGDAIATSGLTGGAGTVLGSTLEMSNSDVASEFVDMIQAQNGFQANARTIRVANDILRELASLIR